jgi:hypothetical protein
MNALKARYEVLREPHNTPPYRVRVFDRQNRLVAFRRFWTRIEAEDWGSKLAPSR